ncbi:MAG: FAD-dependent oxidoreductase [Erysipelotrichaceae bacterium]|nr:FAD-dependent oxidoreductase [Erysipelotrichaceae bacterium]
MVMVKKIRGILIVLLSLTLFACSTTNKQPTTETTYTAGTYTGVGNGRNGEIKVDVTFDTEKITEIVIVSQSETENIADLAIETIPEMIVNNQSLGIDSVSGATITSEAIIEAVADAVKQAGGDPEALKNVVVNKEPTKTIELDTDVVVVGGGGAGMAATIRLGELGKKVILLEKASYLGGAISVSGGNQVVMGSKLQKEAGVTDDSVESMVDDFYKNGANLNVPELITLYAENIGETTDWLNEYCKVEYDMEGGLHKLGEYSYDRELAYVDGGPGFTKTIKLAVEESGAEVYLNTRAYELIEENGIVVGVKAKDIDGNEYIITSSNVILATGGYGFSDELLTPELQSALYYGPETSTGDGVIMATVEGIDADTRLMEYGKRYPNGIEVSEGKAKSTIAGNIVGWTMSAILVNAEGERVVNEKASNRTILETEIEQTNGMLYLLLDSKTFDIWKTKLKEAGITEEDIERYVSENGKTTPVFANGNTLEEVAKVVDMDPTTLIATVEKYNSYVTNGKDLDFDRPKDFMNETIGEGPYYLIEQKPRFATTMGGLVVNESLEVINKNGDVIQGLFAAGEVVGGVMGDDSPSGANNGWALTSGKLAAESIAQ